MKLREGRRVRAKPLPLGIKLLVGFFAFGATMCSFTVLMLIWPGGLLEPLWRLNPEAHTQFQSLGRLAVFLMLVVGSACATAAIGLARAAEWGRRLAIGILLINLGGDLINAIWRSDWRTLIGLPVAGLMILYLMTVSSPSSRA